MIIVRLCSLRGVLQGRTLSHEDIGAANERVCTGKN